LLNITRLRKEVIIFLGITFFLSALCWLPIIASGSTETLGGLLALALMWCPGLAAFITYRIYRQSNEIGWKINRSAYLALSYTLPLIYGGVAYGLIWLVGLAGYSGNWPGNIGQLVIAGTIGGIISALGEEVGWRGFLVPMLAKSNSFTGTGLISGLVWALWHFPLLIFTNYDRNGVALWFSLPCFVLSVIGLSFISAWLRLKSGSIGPSVLLHASSNLFILHVFNPLTSATGKEATWYLLGENGLVTGFIIGIIALILWTQRHRLPTNPSAVSPISSRQFEEEAVLSRS
jgi:membrane protease YdiL (CAAX protease family)